ncbi:unnamed protein product [Lactuca saligna]|uniref:Uncharacterized protein n=1 Tax=Lactuca saligna TaxID=75948 RepID=A0AA35ZWZ6_LACSI|nr:unnamed protein product [Lactuca saligna]
MAASSETPSGADQFATSGLLGIKANQNLILDLDPSKYDTFLQPLIECLRRSPLVDAITKSVHVLVHLSKAFLTVHYEEGSATMIFEVGNQQSTITKSQFSRLFGLSSTRDLIDSESIPSSSILEMFYQMRYKDYLIILLKFKKPNLPPMWNGFFTLIFKSFSERHLAEKLKPIFSMLDRIQGVLESSIPKQGGEPAKTSAASKGTEGKDEHEKKPKSNNPKGNEASASKGKEKMALRGYSPCKAVYAPRTDSTTPMVVKARRSTPRVSKEYASRMPSVWILDYRLRVLTHLLGFDAWALMDYLDKCVLG